MCHLCFIGVNGLTLESRVMFTPDLRTELRPLISPLPVSPPYKVPLHVLQQVLNSLADVFTLLVVVHLRLGRENNVFPVPTDVSSRNQSNAPDSSDIILQ